MPAPDADVCVIGAGITGLAVAAELERAGLHVVVVDRARRPGGAGNEWYGRLGVLEPMAFERRPWVPGSGWPIAREDLLAVVPRAAAFFGLPDAGALDPATWTDDPAVRALRGEGVDAGVHVWPPRPWRPADARPKRLLLGAPARRLVAGTDRVESLVLGGSAPDAGRSPRARRAAPASVKARAFVLAAGAHENARLLLRSSLGGDAVGRYLMDHPRVAGVARVRLHRSARAEQLVERRRPRRAQLWLGVDDEVQRREELLVACSFLYPPSGPRAAARRIGRWPRPSDRLVLVDQVEQVPDRDSRVTLDDVDWRVGSDTARTLRRHHELVGERLEAAGIGTLEVADGPLAWGDAAHAMGTTRMSADPQSGVVDADGRVHGVENLYVTGGSVFPAGGAGPPTLTMVCLALRVADAIRARTAPRR